MGYGPKSGNITNTSATLPDDQNFFARFEAHNSDSSTSVRSSPEATDIQVTQDTVSRVFKKFNAQKAASPDGIASRALKKCYNQLSWVYNDIFNMSLSLSVVPCFFCFFLKKNIIVPIATKNPVICVKDYRPVALTSVLMKSFERMVISYI